MTTFNPVPPAVFASVLAGPTFYASLIAANLVLTLPAAMPVGVADAGAVVFFLVLATIIGFLLAFIPNLLGTAGMRMLASVWSPARLPVVWAAVGAAVGAALALLAGAGPDVVAALVTTSASCALVCRLRAGDPASSL